MLSETFNISENIYTINDDLLIDKIQKHLRSTKNLIKYMLPLPLFYTDPMENDEKELFITVALKEKVSLNSTIIEIYILPGNTIIDKIISRNIENQ